MGKKNFVENYDPLKAHLTRDAERSSGPQPTAPSRSAAQPAKVAAVPVQEDEELPEPREEAAPRRKAGGGEASRLVQRKPQPKPEDLDASPEMSARIKVSSAAFQDLEALLSNVHRATGSKVHYSIATRALWGLLVQAEAQVVEEVRKASLGRLPSTRGRLEYAEYEERVKLAFANAFRKLPRTAFQAPVNSTERESVEG